MREIIETRFVLTGGSRCRQHRHTLNLMSQVLLPSLSTSLILCIAQHTAKVDCSLLTRILYVYLLTPGLYVSVTNAEITNTGAIFSSKPDAYLELIVDGQSARKTEVIRKSTSPRWDDIFTVWVSPTYVHVVVRVSVLAQLWVAVRVAVRVTVHVSRVGSH